MTLLQRSLEVPDLVHHVPGIPIMHTVKVEPGVLKQLPGFSAIAVKHTHTHTRDSNYPYMQMNESKRKFGGREKL